MPRPRIPTEFLECVIYLYRSAELAREGSKVGGSGFLVAVPLDAERQHATVYAVTNNHVFRECGEKPAIRLNTQKGEIDVIVTDKRDWMPDPNANDVAICPIRLSEGVNGHRFSVVHSDLFVTREYVERGVIAPGEETFMVGRFVNVQGVQRNTPALRFGNIAMLPYEPIEVDGLKQESFLVECRSVPGYSGSPVFAYDPQKYKRGRSFVESYDHLKATGPWLLGIDWCHIHTYEPTYDVERQGEEIIRTRRNDLETKSNTAMAGVIPAWILKDLLFQEELVTQREEALRKLR